MKHKRWRVRVSINSIYDTGNQSHSLSQESSIGRREKMLLGQGQGNHQRDNSGSTDFFIHKHGGTLVNVNEPEVSPQDW